MQLLLFERTHFSPEESTNVQFIRSSSFFGFVPRVREQSPKVPVFFSGIATIATLSPVLSGKHPIRGIAKHPIRGITHPAAWTSGSRVR